MFTALALSLAIGAPVPAPSPPVPVGAPPRVMELKPDADGKFNLTVLRTGTQKVQVLVAGANGQAVPETRDVPVSRYEVVDLGTVKDLTITTADGKKVDQDEAMKKLSAGAIVVMTTDGKPVSPVFLKVFKDDTLVLASPELVMPQQGVVRPGVRTGPIRIAPAAGGVVPAVPLLPAAVPAAPAKPAPPAPKPAAAKPVDK